MDGIKNYNKNLYNFCKELHRDITIKFNHNPSKYFDQHERITQMMSNIQDINQTVSDYANQMVDFKTIFMDNFIKIAGRIKDDGVTDSHLCKLKDTTRDMMAHVYDYNVNRLTNSR